MRRRRLIRFALLLTLVRSGVAGAGPGAGRKTIVVCAPGYPGTTAQAQPTMDAFGESAARAVGWSAGSLGAVYYETEQGGLAHLGRSDAVLALVPLPFFLQHGGELRLTPRLEVVLETGATEVWSLVAKKDQLSSAASLAGWEITGAAGYADRFILGPALGGFGPLPAGIRVTFTTRALAALRRAASGEKVAVLVDRAQSEAIGSLPFGGDLEVVARSNPLPASLLCTVGDRLKHAEADALLRGLLRLHERPEGAEVLKSMQMVRFEAVDRAALEGLRRPSSGEPVSSK